MSNRSIEKQNKKLTLTIIVYLIKEKQRVLSPNWEHLRSCPDHLRWAQDNHKLTIVQKKQGR